MARGEVKAVKYSRERLNKALSNSMYLPAFAADNNRVNYIDDHLAELKVASIVSEPIYIDTDYLEDYATFYSGCHREYQRSCKRIHFFAKPDSHRAVHSPGMFEKLFFSRDTNLIRAFKDAYLGFVVVRPLPEAIIGRTVLKCWPNEANGRLRYFTVVGRYVAHLLGIEFVIEHSLPFQEQDSACGACATIALWSAFQQAARLFGTTSPRPSSITRLASPLPAPAFGRTIPSHGLSVYQICTAIRSIGLEPELFRMQNSKGGRKIPWLSLIYSYVSAGVPAILVVGIPNSDKALHAVTVCGYCLHDPPRMLHKAESAKPPPLPMSGMTIPEFYVHDDRRGPFCHYFVKHEPTKTDQRPLLVEYEEPLPDNRTQRVLEPLYIIVPVCSEIRITFVDAHEVVSQIAAVLQLLLVTPSGSGREVARFHWDLRLMKSSDLKEYCRDHSLGFEAYRSILESSLPGFVWHARLLADTELLWELVMDATDTHRSTFIVHSVWHSQILRAKLSDQAEVLELESPGKLFSIVRPSLAHWLLADVHSH